MRTERTSQKGERCGSSEKAFVRLCRKVLVLLVLAIARDSGAAIDSPTVVEISGGETVSEWVALAHAVRSKNLEVVGIVITTPPGEGESALRLADQLRKIQHRPDIPLIHAVCESVPVCPFELDSLFARGALPNTERTEIGTRVLGLVDKYSGNLQFLSVGSMEGILAAWKRDPSCLSKIRRLVLSGVHLDGPVLTGIAKIGDEAGDLLQDCSAPIVIFPDSVSQSVRFHLEDQKSLASARTPLTDALTYLIAREALRSDSPSEAWEKGIALPHSAMITYSFQQKVATLETRQVSVGSSAGKPISVLTAIDCKGEIVVGNLIYEFINPLTDFGLGFSHYLFSLGRLSSPVRAQISEQLKNLPAPDALRDATESADTKIQLILDYLESSIRCFDPVKTDPGAKDSRKTLVETYTQVASIGWLFPEPFYSTWTFPAAKPGPIPIRFGISNPRGRKIESITLGILHGEELVSEEIDSATGDVWVELEGEGPEVTLLQRFVCAGTVCESTRSVRIGLSSTP